MGVVPRQRVKISKAHFGRPQDNTYVEHGLAESLLLSMPHHRLKNGAWSGGGPFFQVTDITRHLGARSFPGYMRIIWRDPTDAIGVVGVPIKFTVPDPKSYKSDWTTYQSASALWTAKGYHVTRPGNPLADLGQFLVELRDLPKIPFAQGRTSYLSVFKQGFSLSRAMHELRGRSIWSVSTYRRMLGAGWTPGKFIDAVRRTASNNLSPERLFPGVGGEYLNLIFGWKPFIGDVRKAFSLWSNIDKQMAQIVRDNGKGIRRTANLSKENEILSTSSKDYPTPGVNIYGFPGDYVNGGGRTSYSLTTTRETKVWYAAKYRYYIPDVTSSQWNRRAKLALFGALPTPELVWELTPFSWLIDWAVNMEDVMSNMSTNAVDNLVQLYSFIMRTVTTTTTAVANTNWGPITTVVKPGNAAFISEKTQIVKTRTGGGSPYALNAVAGTGLSLYQSGVLAALGISLST